MQEKSEGHQVERTKIINLKIFSMDNINKEIYKIYKTYRDETSQS